MMSGFTSIGLPCDVGQLRNVTWDSCARVDARIWPRICAHERPTVRSTTQLLQHSDHNLPDTVAVCFFTCSATALSRSVHSERAQELSVLRMPSARIALCPIRHLKVYRSSLCLLTAARC